MVAVAPREHLLAARDENEDCVHRPGWYLSASGAFALPLSIPA